MSLLLALLLCVSADTYTVDDDGGHADFPSLVAAAAVVGAGDIVHVMAGTYEPFILTKNVMILGPASGPRPRVEGRSVVHDVTGAMIGGLDFGSFAANTVSGSLLLDDCTFGVGGLVSVSTSTLDLVACDAAEVQRCTIRGLDDSAGTALRAVDSRVSVVACLIVAGRGEPASAQGCVGDGGKGGTAIRATNTYLNVTNCVVRGGQGGVSCGLPALDGAAGDGLVASQSLTIVRGAPTDSVSDGPWDPVTSSPGKEIVLSGGKLAISGVNYHPSAIEVIGGGLLMEPGHAEPWFSLNDAFGAGEVLEMRLEGPVGAPALLFGGVLPELFALNKLEGPLWLAADHSLFIITLVTQGAGTPVVLPFPIPVGLDGLDIHLQAVFPSVVSEVLPGKVVVTNPVSPLIRF